MPGSLPQQGSPAQRGRCRTAVCLDAGAPDGSRQASRVSIRLVVIPPPIAM
ncbi:hypothetical protein ACFPM0_31495 [Pseudonocardia sulfidoxydans]|uniref:hypothetical protein n=1 Tax=Pseudonocardia sulfidoxydans TaxID=54011 RepID=UPI0036082D6A